MDSLLFRNTIQFLKCQQNNSGTTNVVKYQTKDAISSHETTDFSGMTHPSVGLQIVPHSCKQTLWVVIQRRHRDTLDILQYYGTILFIKPIFHSLLSNVYSYFPSSLLLQFSCTNGISAWVWPRPTSLNLVSLLGRWHRTLQGCSTCPFLILVCVPKCW